jgi:hypothetical protein
VTAWRRTRPLLSLSLPRTTTDRTTFKLYKKLSNIYSEIYVKHVDAKRREIDVSRPASATSVAALGTSLPLGHPLLW